MKLDFSSGKTDGKAYPPPNADRHKYTPPYRANEVMLQQSDPAEVYNPEGRRWAAQFSVPVVGSLQQAIDLRNKGQFVLTQREADAAARLQVQLSNRLLRDSMVVDPRKGGCASLIVEGIPGVKNNIYELRNQYNRGVQFHKTGKYDIAPQAQREAADRKMKELVRLMEEAGFPLWPEEVENGIPTELCKPEYMTWHQYQEATKQEVFLFDMTPVEFDAADSEAEPVASGE